jgi:hypothetical protein
MVQVLKYGQCIESSLGALHVIALFTLVEKKFMFYMCLPDPTQVTTEAGLS